MLALVLTSREEFRVYSRELTPQLACIVVGVELVPLVLIVLLLPFWSE